MTQTGCVVLADAHAITFARVLSFLSAVRLEAKGLRHSRGSMTARAKRVYGIKGSRQQVIQHLEAMRDQMLRERKALVPSQ